MSIWAILAQTLCYVLIAWVCAFAATLMSFLAVSVDDLDDVVTSALRGSAPAMWLVPAFLLLAAPEPIVETCALVMIAAVTCLLFTQPAPHRLKAVNAIPVESQLFRVTLGAFALQSGVSCLYAGYRLWSASLVALAIATWTRSWIARGAAPATRGRLSPAWSLLSIVLALLLSALLLPRSPGIVASTGELLGRLVFPDPPPVAPTRSAVPVFSAQQEASIGRGGLPGILLRPDAKPRKKQLRIQPARSNPLLSMSEPLTFPFTGEYHIFRTSSGQLPDGSPVETGTPLESVYGTTNSGSIETQAWQPLIPPVDFSRCAEVQLALRSGEPLPSAASLQLVATSGAELLSTEIFGLHPKGEETVTFVIPYSAHRSPVQALHVIFQHNPAEAAKSTRVAILRITLIPRNY